MERIINKITEVLEAQKTLFVNSGLESIETIDIYKGQPESPEKFEFGIPAVFIDYNINYDQELAYIILHALYEDDNETENYSPQRNEGLKYITFLKLIKRCLKGVKLPPVFGALKLSEDTPTQSGDFNYHQITFECSYHEELDNEGKFVDVEISGVLEGGKIKG